MNWLQLSVLLTIRSARKPYGRVMKNLDNILYLAELPLFHAHGERSEEQ